MKKKMVFIIILVVLVLMFCGCSSTSVYPRLCIEPTYYRDDAINIPLRKDYKFAEDPYDIIETETGYDIIVHVYGQ